MPGHERPGQEAGPRRTVLLLLLPKVDVDVALLGLLVLLLRLARRLGGPLDLALLLGLLEEDHVQRVRGSLLLLLLLPQQSSRQTRRREEGRRRTRGCAAKGRAFLSY